MPLIIEQVYVTRESDGASIALYELWHDRQHVGVTASHAEAREAARTIISGRARNLTEHRGL